MSSGIVFQVETTRILKILAHDIYDSPMALLRENLQNAYDAIRMRLIPLGRPLSEGRIDVTVDGEGISIRDNGVGMSEETLKDNFWKAGASGKNSVAARSAGVVGTFGIGAMANFGVCSRLVVETQVDGGVEALRSVAERSLLKIGQECITLDKIARRQEAGTTVRATLDPEHRISEQQARQYLDQYASFLPVPVFLNGRQLSGSTFEAKLPLAGRTFSSLGSIELSDGFCAAHFDVQTDQNAQLLVSATKVSLSGNPVDGSVMLLQAGGQLMGLRSLFGLAPIPVAGDLQFGGFANLSFLQPTAGREAVTRESIEQVTKLLNLAERAACELLAPTSGADKNNGFLAWLRSHSRYDLAHRVTVQMFPEDVDVALGDVVSRKGSRTIQYYTGSDKTMIATFANESAALLQLATNPPRRSVQLHYVSNILKVPQVPDTAHVIRVYESTECNYAQAAVLVHIASILRDDYLIPNIGVSFADISHGVTVLPKKDGEQLHVFVARSSPSLPSLFQCYEKSGNVFHSFMKDYVRGHVYQAVQQFVPSSTRDGVDALRKMLERNRELYRYEEAELGELTSVLGEYLSGSVSFEQVLTITRAAAAAQSQTVSREQVGTIERVVPDVVESPVVQPVQEGSGAEFPAMPPIIRDEVETKMKVLTTDGDYPQLNNFKMLLGLSDRFMLTEAGFFRTPHTTRILWGGHRVIYIFTDVTGRFNLYYDVELRAPVEGGKAGGAMFPTTTLVTKDRIFVPVPKQLTQCFSITSGSKEFYVRFDTLISDIKE